jgi:hypothetical protein
MSKANFFQYDPASPRFQKTMEDTRGKGHYKFKSTPNPAKAELAIGTMIGGIRLPHVTIECTRAVYVHPRTQVWINETIIPHMSDSACLVIVIVPASALL